MAEPSSDSPTNSPRLREYDRISALSAASVAASASRPMGPALTVEQVAGLSLPNLVGQNIDAVQQWAGQNQLTIQPTTVTSTQPQGTIVTQSPGQNAVVTSGQTISVSVSNGTRPR